ncbi:MAG: sigma-E processing peptidase SpoIIGA [Clostridia bacterium]|nr:sigma-E processing peptidase SpoIIGA [Clostridia bacterium]
MKIYLDYIFLENLVVNLIVIEELTVFVKDRLKLIKKILISAMISLYTTVIYIYSDSWISSNIVKILVISIAIYLLYKPRKINYYIKLIIVYYLISFLYVGTVISIALLFKISLENMIFKLLLYLISGIILNIFTKYIWKIFKSNIKSNDLIYIMYIGNQKIKSFVDTGSNVKDNITGLDVIFINCKYYEEIKKSNILNKETYIDIQTVAGKQKVKGYIVENIDFFQNNKRVAKIKKIVISFTLQEMENAEKYSALIGYNTYIENLKGVTI